MKKVVVGLSGGVDSSVAALLLKEQGYEVIGLFMKNWHDDSVVISRECPWLDDSNDALIVAQKLGIPFQTVDLSVAYKERIVDYMFREYQQGRTPNPDVLCNREIKFDLFLKIAIQLGADFVATGHYCRKDAKEDVNGNTIYRLLSGVDRHKDQSYFLCQLNQEQLSRALFPIGELTKTEVRSIASQNQLITADKKDSQGLCFIGKVRLPEFLQQQLQPREGVIVEIPANSARFYIPKPIFSTEAERLAYQATKAHYALQDGKVVGKHNGLFRSTLFVNEAELHWVRSDMAMQEDQSMQVMARIRYRQPLQAARLYKVAEGMYVDFNTPQSAITEGQFVAWYVEDELLGSGVIS